MRVPQVNERVKEAPASALRAMFAGIGSLLFVRDKIRHKPAAEATASARGGRPETAAPETPLRPRPPLHRKTPLRRRPPPHRDAAAPETAAPADRAVAPEDGRCPDAGAETAAPRRADSEEAAALPLANYDELTIASLRARLRNLSADQLTVLIDYEKATRTART